MLSAILEQLLPSGLCWLILSGMIECLNGWGTGMDTIGSTGWTTLLLVLSFAVFAIAINFLGACPNLSVSPAFTIGKTDYYVSGKDVWTGKKNMRGTGGLFLQFIINLIKCMFVFPVVGIINLIMCLIKGDFIGNFESIRSSILGYAILGVAFLAFVIPFGLHKGREIKYDCEKFEYALEDIYYTEGDGDQCIHFDLNVKHPSEEISSICGKLHFYLDGELVESVTYEFIHNRSTTGLLSIEPGDQEDLPEVTISSYFWRGDYDWVELFSQKSDRLVIVHELTEASFMKDMVEAGWEYCETLPTTTIYSLKD